MARNAVQRLLLSGKALDELAASGTRLRRGSGWPPSPISQRGGGLCWNPAAWTGRASLCPSTSPPGGGSAGPAPSRRGDPRHRHPSAGDDPGNCWWPWVGRPPASDRGGVLRPAGEQPSGAGDLETAGGASLPARRGGRGCLTLWLDKCRSRGGEGALPALQGGRRIRLLRRGNLEWLHHHDVDGMRGWQHEGPSPLHRPDPAGPRAFGRLGRHHGAPFAGGRPAA